MMKNETMEHCSHIFSDEAFFCDAFQTRVSKTVLVIASIILSLFDIVLLYGAIWYEHFGSGNKRTLVNRLFTSLCWSCMASIVIGLFDIVRYSIGPWPRQICQVLFLLRKIVKDEIVLYYDAITFARYIFIFWLKNPTAVEESFWSLFINIWIAIASIIYATIYSMLPAREVIFFYICCGLDPTIDGKLPEKPDGMVLIFSIVFQLVLNARIFTWKHFKNTKNGLHKFYHTKMVGRLEKEALMNFSAICWGFFFIFLFYGLNKKFKSLPAEEINIYPNYIYLYCLQLVSYQFLGFLMLIVMFSKNKNMRTKILQRIYRKKELQ
jgi:hypothetical protein